MKFTAAGLLCLTLALAACSNMATAPSAPLADNLQLVPVSDKADKASGLVLTYLYGTNDGELAHIACDRAKNCWITGILGQFHKKDDERINSLVIHTTGVSHINWANAYQLNGVYTVSDGFLMTRDGGTLLYGNSILRSSFGIRLEPVYEKLDATGHPKWGGAIPAGAIKPWSAFSDAVRTRDGGYLLIGSAHMVNQKNTWYGVLVKVNSSGKITWAEELNSSDDPTFINGVVQLKDGKILAVGYNAKRRDVVLFRLTPNGKVSDSVLLKIRGREIPIGLTSTLNGEDVAVSQKMPSGENAAILLDLDKKGRLQSATRYHYTDGFNPNNVIALSARSVCLFGTTSSKDHPQSVAIALNAKRVPTSALIMKSDSAFNSAALFDTGTVIFAGNRAIGTDRRMTPLLTLWTPELNNNPQVMKNVHRDTLDIAVDRQIKAKATPWEKPQWQFLPPDVLPFRSIYATGKPAAGKASQ